MQPVASMIVVIRHYGILWYFVKSNRKCWRLLLFATIGCYNCVKTNRKRWRLLLFATMNSNDCYDPNNKYHLCTLVCMTVDCMFYDRGSSSEGPRHLSRSLVDSGYLCDELSLSARSRDPDQLSISSTASSCGPAPSPCNRDLYLHMAPSPSPTANSKVSVSPLT